eukprot:3426852-Rhodomonas_salina.7
MSSTHVGYFTRPTRGIGIGSYYAVCGTDTTMTSRCPVLACAIPMMSGTDIGYADVGSGNDMAWYYAMSGTDIGYGRRNPLWSASR